MSIQIREYGLAKCVGEKNLATAIQARASQGYNVAHVVFTGVVQVVPKSGILNPNETPPTLSSYLLVVERVLDVGPSVDG